MIREDNTSTEPKGTVVDQSPAGGQPQPQGTDINLFVSTYEEPTEEPSEDPTDLPTDPTESPTATDSSSPIISGRRAEPGRQESGSA